MSEENVNTNAIDNVSEPQRHYGMTPTEKDIIYDLALLRGHEDVLRHIQIFVRQKINDLNNSIQDESQRASSRREALEKMKSYSGFLSETGESDRQRLNRILNEKYNSQ